MKTQAVWQGTARRTGRSLLPVLVLACAVLSVLAGCAPVDVPGTRAVTVPKPAMADERPEAVNELPDSVMYLPLGRDVLVPTINADDSLPADYVGPFELRSESLAGALQLILADYDISLAFETDEGLNRRITVANLQGPLNKVIEHVCALADLYCAYEDDLLVIKDTQTFTVKIPPISQDTGFMNNVASGLAAIIGKTPILDQSTRTLIYEATNRTAEYAQRYFQQMRASTAMIVFETYIWEVNLESGNSTGVRWDLLDSFGKFTASVALSGTVGADFSNPVSIGLPTTGYEHGGPFTPGDIFEFLSRFGAVKTISQPKITVLSGSEAKLRVADTQNFVSQISQTIDSGQVSTSVNTSSVDTGFDLTISSSWDNATVYADINISLTNVTAIDNFPFSSQGTGDNATSTTIQLPKTAERELTTQVRIRPGDSLLIAGLVREADNFEETGPGFSKPVFPSSRTAQTENLELVFLMRPRVVVYTSPDERKHYSTVRGMAVSKASPPAPAAAPQEPHPLLPGAEPDADVEDPLTLSTLVTQAGDEIPVDDPAPEAALLPEAPQDGVRSESEAAGDEEAAEAAVPVPLTEVVADTASREPDGSGTLPEDYSKGADAADAEPAVPPEEGLSLFGSLAPDLLDPAAGDEQGRAAP